VSTATVAPPAADAATVFPATGADPIARCEERIAAEQALADLERAVQRLAQRFFAPTAQLRRYVPRRSRRSAWTPSDWSS
jgi:hypothetical protein